MSVPVSVSRSESAQIEILRTLCITMMMWVHVSPGLSNPSFVSTGGSAWIGAFFGDFLGRASVSTLSFLSGYLLWSGGTGQPLPGFLNRQFRTLILPMVFWGEIFILLLLAKLALTGDMPTTLRSVAYSPLGILDQIVGLTVPTANLSLFFLRDLVVVAVLVRLAAPAIRRWPLLVAAVVIPWSVALPTEPVIFRPLILTFFLGGVLAARFGLRIDRMSRPAFALPAAAAAYGAYLVLTQALPGTLANTTDAVPVLHRISVSLLMLTISRQLAGTAAGASLARAGRYMFLCFLSHLPIIGLLWAVWSRVAGGPGQPVYAVFYLAAPFVSVAIALHAGRWLNTAPAGVQRLIRGKAFGPAGQRRRPAATAETLSATAGDGR